MLAAVGEGGVVAGGLEDNGPFLRLRRLKPEPVAFCRTRRGFGISMSAVEDCRQPRSTEGGIGVSGSCSTFTLRCVSLSGSSSKSTICSFGPLFSSICSTKDDFFLAVLRFSFSFVSRGRQRHSLGKLQSVSQLCGGLPLFSASLGNSASLSSVDSRSSASLSCCSLRPSRLVSRSRIRTSLRLHSPCSFHPT